MREAEIKQALANHLAQERNLVSRTFLEELEVSGGEVRADFVDVSDMHCYEIKSEADTFRRLIGQGSRYARVFDRITLVTSERHLKKALPMVPLWWGIMLIPDYEGMGFRQVRTAKPNNKHEVEVLATLLSKEEALDLLEVRGITRGWRSKSLYMIQAYIAEILTLDELRVQVQAYLHRRFVSQALVKSTSSPA